MSFQLRLLPLLLSFACLCALALAQDTPPPSQPSALTVPATDRLQLDEICHRGLMRQPDDHYAVMFRTDDLRPIAGSRVQLGTSLFDVRVSNALKFSWLPTSLYVFPVVETDTFTKTGAASVRYLTPDGKEAHPWRRHWVFSSGNITASVTHTKNGVEVSSGNIEIPIKSHATASTTEYTPSERVVISDPTATTTFTYNRFALYGVATANMNHIFDWGASPLRTGNERVGVGVMWAKKQRDITDGVAYDLQSAGEKSVSPSAHVSAPMRGFEVSRSISGGEPTWYFSLIFPLQK